MESWMDSFYSKIELIETNKLQIYCKLKWTLQHCFRSYMIVMVTALWLFSSIFNKIFLRNWFQRIQVFFALLFREWTLV